MKITQETISLLLKEFKRLLEEIGPLRHQVETLERALDQTGREYQQVVGEVLRRRDSLLADIRNLEFLLSEKEPPPPPSSSTPGEITPPPPVEATPVSPGEGTRAFPMNLRLEQKRQLADYICAFLPSGEEETIYIINAIVADDQMGVGEMLELLSWESYQQIWGSLTEKLGLDEQYEQLGRWRDELGTRHDHWQRRLSRLRDDPNFRLWERRELVSPEEWNAHLQELVQAQQKENAALEAQVDRLSAVWHARQNSGEATDE